MIAGRSAKQSSILLAEGLRVRSRRQVCPTISEFETVAIFAGPWPRSMKLSSNSLGQWRSEKKGWRGQSGSRRWKPVHRVVFLIAGRSAKQSSILLADGLRVRSCRQIRWLRGEQKRKRMAWPIRLKMMEKALQERCGSRRNGWACDPPSLVHRAAFSPNATFSRSRKNEPCGIRDHPLGRPTP